MYQPENLMKQVHSPMQGYDNDSSRGMATKNDYTADGLDEGAASVMVFWSSLSTADFRRAQSGKSYRSRFDHHLSPR